MHQRRTAEAQPHAVGFDRDLIRLGEEPADRIRLEPFFLRPEHDPDRPVAIGDAAGAPVGAGRCGGPAQRQPVAGAKIASGKPAETAASIGRSAAHDRVEREAAGDGQSAAGAVGQAADREFSAAAERDAAPGGDRPAVDAQAGRGTDQRQPHRLGLDRAAWTQCQDFQHGLARLVADQGIGETGRQRVERARHRHAVALQPKAAQILDRRGEARPVEGQPGADITVAHGCLTAAHGCRHSCAGSKDRSARMRRCSTLSIGRNRTSSPGASRAGGVARGSNSGTGQLPIRCQPPGLSVG